jgi:hypothetical protein
MEDQARMAERRAGDSTAIGRKTTPVSHEEVIFIGRTGKK